jgi:hypothetical protein
MAKALKLTPLRPVKGGAPSPPWKPIERLPATSKAGKRRERAQRVASRYEEEARALLVAEREEARREERRAAYVPPVYPARVSEGAIFGPKQAGASEGGKSVVVSLEKGYDGSLPFLVVRIGSEPYDWSTFFGSAECPLADLTKVGTIKGSPEDVGLFVMMLAVLLARRG